MAGGDGGVVAGVCSDDADCVAVVGVGTARGLVACRAFWNAVFWAVAFWACVIEAGCSADAFAELC